AGNDQHGANLKLLLGFEREAKDERLLQTPMMPGIFLGKRKGVGGVIPGQPLDRSRQTTFGGLPQGQPLVEGVTAAITWKFGCMLQQSVYELMQERWRAKVCPECGKFILADKTRQMYCSSTCFGEMKRKRALDYWNRKGSAERDRRRMQKGRKP